MTCNHCGEVSDFVYTKCNWIYFLKDLTLMYRYLEWHFYCNFFFRIFLS